MLYVLAVLIFYNTKRDNRYQEYFVAVGLLHGIVDGAISTSPNPSLEAMKDYIPMSITIGLLASWICHILLSWFGPRPKNA
jgi:hypothetical protein